MKTAVSELRSGSRVNTLRSFSTPVVFHRFLPPALFLPYSLLLIFVLSYIRNSDRRRRRGAAREGEKTRGPLAIIKGEELVARGEQRQRSSRQINLRRDLRSRTSLSAYVYTRACASADLACVRVRERGGLSSIGSFRGCVGHNTTRTSHMDQLLPSI